jgi:hypothetical protein
VFSGLILCSLLAGCSLPRYGIHTVDRHKDVVAVLVTVPQRLSPRAYRAIAHSEIQRVLEARRNRELPLYEVRFDFVAPEGSPDNRVARLVYRAVPLPASDPSFLVVSLELF